MLNWRTNLVAIALLFMLTAGCQIEHTGTVTVLIKVDTESLGDLFKNACKDADDVQACVDSLNSTFWTTVVKATEAAK